MVEEKRKMIAVAKTPKIMQDVFGHHLPYEIDRLVGKYRLLLEPQQYRSLLPLGRAKTPATAETLDDALFVGFCTHARNLLEFFYRRPQGRAAAADHANAPYEPLDKSRCDVKTLTTQLNAQINHLTYERTDEASEKIGSKERKDLIDLIHTEACRLEKCLKSEYDTKYLRIDLLAEAARMKITAGAVAPTGYHGQ
jgi:hypothetical protein